MLPLQSRMSNALLSRSEEQERDYIFLSGRRMSEYGANYYGQKGQPENPGMGHHSQYGNYGQRNDVQFV